MGRPLSGPEFFEYRMTDYLEALFKRLGLPYQRQTIEPKRENIVARLDGSLPAAEGGPFVLLEAHQDTVPVDGMSIDPFQPQVRDGRLYGRGSCDIKGGMCAMLGALSRLAEERPPGLPTIVMACTVNEEHGYTGALNLPKLWQSPGSIIPRRPDAAIVAEPTNLQVVVAHKGTVRWRCHTRGRAVHSSVAHLGDNAIYKMARAIRAFEAYHREIVPTLPQHRLCGPASLSVGTIRGGISVNTVPDECGIEIDRRLLPGEDGKKVYQQIVDFVGGYAGVDFPLDHETPFMLGPPMSDDLNGPLADRLVAAGRPVVGKCEKVGVPYGTDAATITNSGVPSVVFGPGSIDQAHTADEWLPLAELEKASQIIERFLRAYAAA
ncbi:MAG: M20 family metallopeptidase [Planctomycetia bacterium]|nr:M20 family metallopeptidase [Planctomycetia bacterium]